MPRPEPTEIRIDEHGDETHESWLLVRAKNVTCHPGAKLFDSEIAHQRYIQVSVTRCTRARDLHHDWHHNTQTLIEFDMSQAQWGAFVSSFGDGNGVPATLSFFGGKLVPQVSTYDSRLAQSHAEVKGAHAKGMESVALASAELRAAFERGAGKREMRDLLRSLEIKIGQLPGSMEFAAKTLTEHVENVVTKARADIEGMAVQAARAGLEITAENITPKIIEG